MFEGDLQIQDAAFISAENILININIAPKAREDVYRRQANAPPEQKLTVKSG